MSAILKALADKYRASQAGRTGAAARDFGIDYRALLKAAQCEDGEARANAERELRDAARDFFAHLKLEYQVRDQNLIHRVRLSESGEGWLFAHLGESSPSQQRAAVAKGIAACAGAEVPARWQAPWQAWCGELAEKALQGRAIVPLDRDSLEANTELLQVLVRLLNWQGESLMRFASCVLCGHSKRLGELQKKLEACLAQITGREMELKDFGILDHPRQVLLHGPLRLSVGGETLNLGLLNGPTAISETDLQRDIEISCGAARCLTVENEATFRELAKLRTNTLLVHTSYPGRGVACLFAKLPVELPCFHFGDCDPAGFEILRDLQAKTRREIKPLHMEFRDCADSQPLTDKERDQIARLLSDPLLEESRPALRQMLESGRKGRFEQEALGPPGPEWPFYDSPPRGRLSNDHSARSFSSWL